MWECPRQVFVNDAARSRGASYPKFIGCFRRGKGAGYSPVHGVNKVDELCRGRRVRMKSHVEERRSSDVSMLGQHRGCWPSIETALRQCPVSAEKAMSSTLKPSQTSWASLSCYVSSQKKSRWPKAVLMFCRRRRRRPNIKTTLG